MSLSLSPTEKYACGYRKPVLKQYLDLHNSFSQTHCMKSVFLLDNPEC